MLVCLILQCFYVAYINLVKLFFLEVFPFHCLPEVEMTVWKTVKYHLKFTRAITRTMWLQVLKGALQLRAYIESDSVSRPYSEVNMFTFSVGKMQHIYILEY